jgi:archaellum component FlaG (FlaF/FlaG flagellin family)
MLELLVVAGIAFLVGLIVAGFVLARLASNVLRESTEVQEQVQELAQQMLDKLVFLRIEQQPESIYAYNAMTDEFVCQGKDMDDLNINFGKRYPNKKGVLVTDEGEANELVQRN